MVEFIRQYRKNVVVLIVLVLILIVLFLIDIILGNKKDSIKTVQNYDYVYTLEKSRAKDAEKVSSLPQINLHFDSIAPINEEIMELYYHVIEEKKSEFTYEYIWKENLLFLNLKIYFYDEGNQDMETRYISYIIRTNDGVLLSNQEALEILGYPTNIISNTLQKKMLSYYNEAVSKGYIPKEECDFNCYLKWRDMVNIDEGASLFWKDGKLVMYRGFSLHSIYEDDSVFDKDPFVFALEK